jgi:hypothetical protein
MAQNWSKPKLSFKNMLPDGICRLTQNHNKMARIPNRRFSIKKNGFSVDETNTFITIVNRKNMFQKGNQNFLGSQNSQQIS